MTNFIIPVTIVGFIVLLWLIFKFESKKEAQINSFLNDLCSELNGQIKQPGWITGIKQDNQEFIIHFANGNDEEPYTFSIITRISTISDGVDLFLNDSSRRLVCLTPETSDEDFNQQISYQLLDFHDHQQKGALYQILSENSSARSEILKIASLKFQKLSILGNLPKDNFAMEKFNKVGIEEVLKITVENPSFEHLSIPSVKDAMKSLGHIKNIIINSK